MDHNTEDNNPNCLVDIYTFPVPWEIIFPLLCDLEDEEQLHFYVILTDDRYHHQRSSSSGKNGQDLSF